MAFHSAVCSLNGQQISQIKAAFKADNSHIARLKSSSTDGLTALLDRCALSGSILLGEIANSVDQMPREKRQKYSQSLSLIFKSALGSTILAHTLSNYASHESVQSAINDLVASDPINIIYNPSIFCDGCYTAMMCEQHRAIAVHQHLDRLYDERPTLDQSNIASPDTYGAQANTNPYQKAARWIAHASSSFRGMNEQAKASVISNLEGKLRSAKESERNFNTVEGLLRLYENFISSYVTTNYRKMSSDKAVPLLCDKIGHQIMCHYISAKCANRRIDTTLGLQMMGTIIGAHGFIDGNGRFARCVLALCQLIESNGTVFNAPKPDFDTRLNGLSRAV